MAEPLTKEERKFIVHGAEVFSRNADADPADTIILRYEATVAALEAEVARAKDNYQTMLDTACQEVARRQEAEAEVARLREKAELGEAVEGMAVGFGLSHAAEGLWLLWDSREEDDLDETCGPTALAALEAFAAWRAARGGKDA